MRIWVPDIEAPLRHQMVFSLYKKPKSWKRAMPKLSASGKPFMIKNEGDREHQHDILQAFTRKATELRLLDIFPWEGPVALQVYNYFVKPQSHWPGKEFQQRPDIDNLAKQVMDALNPKGVGGWGAYLDDSQVVDLTASKRYDGRGDIISVQLLLFERVTKPLKVRGKRGSGTENRR